MNDLSVNAKRIMQAVYSQYQSNCDNHKMFYDFQQFSDLSTDEIMRYCEELETKGYVLIEYDSDDRMYLYMLPTILKGIKK
jgi:hypothetical protein